MLLRIVRCITAIVLVTLLYGCATERDTFSRAFQDDSIEAYDKFIERYPNGEYSNQARSRREALIQYRIEKEKRTADDIQYILNLKKGDSCEEVRKRLQPDAPSPPTNIEQYIASGMIYKTAYSYIADNKMYRIFCLNLKVTDVIIP